MAEDNVSMYLPQTQGQFFATAYLRSHRQKMQQSLAMAQSEIKSKMDMLDYLKEQEKMYLTYLGKIKGKKGADGNPIQLTVEKMLIQDGQNTMSRRVQIDKMVDNQFSTPPGATGSINKESVVVANNISRGASPGSAVDQAAASVTGYQKGTTQALGVAIQFYKAAEAASSRTSTARQKFADPSINKAFKDAILQHFGLTGMDFNGIDAFDYFTLPGAYEKAKEAKKKELIGAYGGRQTKRSTLEAAAGITTPSTTTSGTGPVPFSNEELMLQRTQARRFQLEQELMGAMDTESMMRRGKEIYNDQYGGNLMERLGARKLNAKVQEQLAAMPPEKQYMTRTLMQANQSNIDPYRFLEMGSMKAGSDESATAKLLQAMITNKGSAKPQGFNHFMDMSTKLTQNQDGTINQQRADKIMGLALKGLSTYDMESNPAQKQARMNQAAQMAAFAEKEEKKAAQRAKQVQNTLNNALSTGTQTNVATTTTFVPPLPVGTNLTPTNTTYAYKVGGYDSNNKPILFYHRPPNAKKGRKISGMAADVQKEAQEKFDTAVKKKKK